MSSLLLPAGLDFREVLPARLWRYIDSAERIVNRVIVGSVWAPRRRWVSIHHRDGYALCDGSKRAWFPVKDALVASGVLQCDGKYEIGEKSFWYRLAPRWLAEPFVGTMPSASAGKGGLRAEAERELRCDPTITEPHIIEHLEGRLGRLEIDEEETMQTIDGIADPGSCRHAELVAGAIKSGDPAYRWMIECRYGRMHSVATQMPRVLRPALRMDGERMAEIDVGATQPTIVGVMAARAQARGRAGERASSEEERPGDGQQHAAGGRRAGGRGAHSLMTPAFTPVLDIEHDSMYPDDCFDELSHHCDHATTKIPGRVIHASNLPSDLAEYLDACVSNRYHEEFADTIGMPCETPVERAAVKRASCWLLMGEPAAGCPQWRRYAERWPSAAGYLERIKRGDYRRAAHLFQRVESDLVIRGACAILARERPEIPIITIHDCIMTTERYVGVVVEALQRPWKELGVIPALKIQRYT
jgi:hypothetical protein